MASGIDTARMPGKNPAFVRSYGQDFGFPHFIRVLDCRAQQGVSYLEKFLQLQTYCFLVGSMGI